jgi:hypothetical protein
MASIKETSAWSTTYHSNGLSLLLLGRYLRIANFREFLFYALR